MVISSTIRSLSAAALLTGSCVLGGCVLPRAVGLTVTPVDPTSPVAQDVINASRHPGPYPKLAEIPPVPTDVRPLSAWRADIADMQNRRSTLVAQAAALPPLSPQPTEDYAAKTRGRLPDVAGLIPPADSRERTEAESRALRERATPPPPPK